MDRDQVIARIACAMGLRGFEGAFEEFFYRAWSYSTEELAYKLAAWS